MAQISHHRKEFLRPFALATNNEKTKWQKSATIGKNFKCISFTISNILFLFFSFRLKTAVVERQKQQPCNQKDRI